MSKPVTIENPVINSPFSTPERHFRFSEEGITDEIAPGRRVSSYFIPIPQPRKKGRQLSLETEWTSERLQENAFINQVRGRVDLWRRRGYPDITRTTRRLLDYWQRPDRERRLFFCQIEALETIIYLTEAAHRQNDDWIANALQEANREANPLLSRIALKMATGSGKTVVMAMLIAWHTLNKQAHRQDARFSDAFLLVTPGITIRDRLRVLLPGDPQNFYRLMDLVPPDDSELMGRAKIVITNFHAFLRRERTPAGQLTRQVLARGQDSPFTETPEQMVRRVCRAFGDSAKNLIVINDEAHHCYRRKPDGEEERLKGEERKEAEKAAEEARIWITGLEAVKAKLGIKAVYDLSATPFFLRGSGYPEGTLFPWVVSDFSLIDAIECGIVKVPRVPVEDDTLTGTLPTYRDIWTSIRDHLPKKKGQARPGGADPVLPPALEGAVQSLYSHYKRAFDRWAASSTARDQGQTPPVFIVVCNNTHVSKLVYDYIAGWEKTLPDGNPLVVPGKLPYFSNETGGHWSARPRTVLIDSAQLESGEAMSEEFKQIAAREIEEFQADYRARFPGRDSGSLTDEDLLREVMNTVGKAGKLGEQVRCVVSVSMLTEGWDANTVTHILGVRAFGTQLLCEQVVGRGLRRRSYAPERRTFPVNGETVEIDTFPVEYAEVYGVPFSFIPCSGQSIDPTPGPTPTRVRALPDRLACEIAFPRLTGYRYELPEDRLAAAFSDDSIRTLTTRDLPVVVENAPIVGESSIHTLDDLQRRRLQEVAFLLAKLVLEKYFRQDGSERQEKPETHVFDPEVQAWLFPQVLGIAKDWLETCVVCNDHTFPQLLLLTAYAHDAADRIYRAIVRSVTGDKRLKPILRANDPVGSTESVDFDTIRGVYPTREDKSHLSHVVLDSGWEAKLAAALESMPEVLCYAKNHGLGFTIPYTIEGEEKNYLPDFLVRMEDGHGKNDPLTLIIEVTGEKRKDKEAKVATARNLWVPAVNAHGGYGRWAFLEIRDPWDAENSIRAAVQSQTLFAIKENE
ncbi:MAG: DEAD/DEAH box helicase family protein [Armatimonadetes bacterium]|nr:DEAD/DEAH box helicase family protein [Armatimonadota bacterium]